MGHNAIGLDSVLAALAGLAFCTRGVASGDYLLVSSRLKARGDVSGLFIWSDT
jgi:hypothetical protein